MTAYERKRARQSLEARVRRAERMRRKIEREQEDLKELEGEIRDLTARLKGERVAA